MNQHLSDLFNDPNIPTDALYQLLQHRQPQRRERRITHRRRVVFVPTSVVMRRADRIRRAVFVKKETTNDA